jgi:hypothetical protein
MKKDEAEQDGTETVRPELSGSRFGRVSEKGGILPGFFSCGGGERTCHDMIGIPDLSGLVSSCRDVIGPMRGRWDCDDSTDGLQVVGSDGRMPEKFGRVPKFGCMGIPDPWWSHPAAGT